MPRILHSFWDRLTERKANDPAYVEYAGGNQKPIHLLKEAVRRNLEWILNTHQPLLAPELRRGHVANSLCSYGLPDLNSISLDSLDDCTMLQQWISDAIQQFEPRLGNVKLAQVRATDAKDRVIHYRIEATLRVENCPETISFDTIMDLSSRRFEILG